MMNSLFLQTRVLKAFSQTEQSHPNSARASKFEYLENLIIPIDIQLVLSYLNLSETATSKHQERAHLNTHLLASSRYLP